MSDHLTKERLSSVAKVWDFSNPDWIQRLFDQESLLPDLPLNDVEAQLAVDMFNRIRLPDVTGKPELRDAAGEWFRDIVRAVFGSMEERDGGREPIRRVREVLALVSKKNSKTTGGAAIMLVALLMNQRPEAEFFLLGPTQAISGIAFRRVKGMINADPELTKMFIIRDHTKEIEDIETKSILKIATFDMAVVTGCLPSGVLVDEIHLLAKIKNAEEIIDQLRGGFVARPDAFIIFISTQSNAPPRGVFKKILYLARSIRDGVVEGMGATILPILYEFPEDIQIGKEQKWKDPELWPLVLPNLGKSVDIDELKRLYATADNSVDREAALQKFAAQHLNVQPGMARHDARWDGVEHWANCADKTLTLDELIQRSEVITAGIDSGGNYDFLSLTLVGRCAETGDYLCWTKSWCYEAVKNKFKEISETIDDFVGDGDLVFCDEESQNTDIDEAVEILCQVHAAGLFPPEEAIGLDSDNIKEIEDTIVAAEIPHELLANIRQGFALSSSIWGAERRLRNKTLWHAGQEILEWCVGNVAAVLAYSGVKFEKQTESSKIDPVIAMINAIALMDRNPEAGSVGSIYDTQGITFI